MGTVISINEDGIRAPAVTIDSNGIKAPGVIIDSNGIIKAPCVSIIYSSKFKETIIDDSYSSDDVIVNNQRFNNHNGYVYANGQKTDILAEDGILSVSCVNGNYTINNKKYDTNKITDNNNNSNNNNNNKNYTTYVDNTVPNLMIGTGLLFMVAGFFKRN
jgi:hypothetical protein